MTLREIQGGETPMGMGLTDYIWVRAGDKLHCKSQVIPVGKDGNDDFVPVIENWQTEGNLILHPCHYLPDPLRPQPCFISLCEVRDTANICIPDNHRAVLRKLKHSPETITDSDAADPRLLILPLKPKTLGGSLADLWLGFDQSYTLHPPPLPIKPMEPRFPVPGKEPYLIAERHLGACMDAGLLIHSARWDGKAPGSFKVGPRGLPQTIDPDRPTALLVCDHLWIARYILLKVAREYGYTVEFTGGLALYLSTPMSRDPDTQRSREEVGRLRGLLHLDPDPGKGTIIKISNLAATADPYVEATRILKQLGYRSTNR